MRAYELAFILSPELDDTASSEIVDKVKGWITDSGGTIEKIDSPGRNKFSYMIRNMKEGYYFFLEIKLPPSDVADLERRLRLEESVLRYLTVKLEE